MPCVRQAQRLIKSVLANIKNGRELKILGHFFNRIEGGESKTCNHPLFK